MSELTIPSGKDKLKHRMRKRFLSTGLKIGLVGLALVASGTLNWHWLVAAGLLPIIFCLLCCGAMYGLHLCSGNKGSNRTPGPMTVSLPGT